MALTNEQMELLHAWVDGETTPAESEIAAQLTRSDSQAQLYVDELKRLRQLVTTYGCVPAPEGLHDRVCAALKNEFAAPVIPLPRAPWRLALAAAAAAVVVSLALVYVPSLTSSGNDTPPAIAESASGKSDARTQMGPGSEPFGTFGKRDERNSGGKDSSAWSDDQHDSKSPSEQADNGLDPRPPVSPTDKSPTKLVPPEGTDGRGLTVAVLSLDRGVDLPFELSVNLNRAREASVLQVYNDMLIVSSMYGSARISDFAQPEIEKQAENLAKESATKFIGTDFSTFDGVEVELDAEDVPQLLAALNRLTAEQNYGEVIVPVDLRKSIQSTTATVDELQDISRELEELARADKPSTDSADSEIARGGARAYLPPEVQRDCVNRDADAISSKDNEVMLGKVLDRAALSDAAKGPGNSLADLQDRVNGNERKIKLVIRLR
ncbi:MAG: hypothetical protein KDB90_06655 [Planctomycetes bacterium]|nr:hypothetical protein [Planctomycetota bacterium]